MQHRGWRNVLSFVGVAAGVMGITPAFGQQMTGAQVVAKCQQAYNALKSYEGTSQVTVKSTLGGVRNTYHTSAKIQFVRPNLIRVEGDMMASGKFRYLSDGKKVWEAMGTGGWQEVRSTEMAVAGATGVSMSAGTTIPALLLKTTWGNILLSVNRPEPKVTQETMNGKSAYRVKMNGPAGESILWIDPKTFLLVKLYEKHDMSRLSRSAPGNTPKMTGSMEATHLFTNVKLNAMIPTSAFANPQ